MTALKAVITIVLIGGASGYLGGWLTSLFFDRDSIACNIGAIAGACVTHYLLIRPLLRRWFA